MWAHANEIQTVPVVQKPREAIDYAVARKTLTHILHALVSEKITKPLEKPSPNLRQRGQTFYQDTKPLFQATDRGFATRRNDPETTLRMVETAMAQGFHKVRATGSKAFRQQAWLYGSLKGLEVDGYQPGFLDRQRLKVLSDAMEKNQPAANKERETPNSPEEKVKEDPKRDKSESKAPEKSSPDKPKSPDNELERVDAPEKAQEKTEPQQRANTQPPPTPVDEPETAAPAVIQENPAHEQLEKTLSQAPLRSSQDPKLDGLGFYKDNLNQVNAALEAKDPASALTVLTSHYFPAGEVGSREEVLRTWLQERFQNHPELLAELPRELKDYGPIETVFQKSDHPEVLKEAFDLEIMGQARGLQQDLTNQIGRSAERVTLQQVLPIQDPQQKRVALDIWRDLQHLSSIEGHQKEGTLPFLEKHHNLTPRDIPRLKQQVIANLGELSGTNRFYLQLTAEAVGDEPFQKLLTKARQAYDLKEPHFSSRQRSLVSLDHLAKPFIGEAPTKIGGTVAGETAAEWRQAFEARKPGKFVAKPLHQATVTLPPDAANPGDRWNRFAENYLARTGMAGHPYLLLASQGRDLRPEIHIIASRVKPDGSLVQPINAFDSFKQAKPILNEPIAKTRGPGGRG